MSHIDHWYTTSRSHHAGAMRAPLAAYQRVCQYQTSMPGSPVAVWADTCQPGKWLLPRVWQRSALSMVSWRSDLRCTTNIQQLWWQNFRSRWTSFVELYRSNCAIQTAPTDSFDNWRNTFLGTMDMALCDFWYVAPYILTYLHYVLESESDFGIHIDRRI